MDAPALSLLRFGKCPDSSGPLPLPEIEGNE